MVLEAEQFWQDSNAEYQREGVKAACLWLQNEKGLNVNLLLLICWIAKQGVELSPNELEEILAAIANWHDQNISLIRQLRKATEAATWMDTTRKEQLKQKLLDSEITMERIEQQLMIEQLNRLPLKTKPNASAEQSFCNYLLLKHLALDEEIQAKFGQLL